MGTIAQLLVRIGLDGLLLDVCAGVLHRAPQVRVARSLGWRVGQSTGDGSRIARLRGGGRMLVDPRDYAHLAAFLYGVYEEDITRLMYHVATPGWTVLDVGANAGYFAVVTADAGGPDSKVVAFEPNPQIRELLERTVTLNSQAAITIVAAACGDTSGSVDLHLSPDPRNSGLSTVLDTLDEAVRITVPLLRLDEYCAERGIEADLIKIDVEGAEEMVLRGAEGLLRGDHPPKHVICEVWPRSREALIDYMGALGYAAYGIRSDGRLTDLDGDDGPWENICLRHEHAATP